MDNCKIINLKKYFNHKLFYKKIPVGNESFGLDGICFLIKNENSDVTLSKDNIDFLISQGTFDNFELQNQVILIDNFAEKLHFLGFAYWGDANENIKILYEDGSEDIICLEILDWTSYPPKGKEWDYLIKDTKYYEPILIETAGDVELEVKIHHFSINVNSKIEIKELIFPENLLIHIFAITIEN